MTLFTVFSIVLRCGISYFFPPHFIFFFFPHFFLFSFLIFFPLFFFSLFIYFFSLAVQISCDFWQVLYACSLAQTLDYELVSSEAFSCLSWDLWLAPHSSECWCHTELAGWFKVMTQTQTAPCAWGRFVPTV